MLAASLTIYAWQSADRSELGDETTDTVVRLVGNVRDKTTTPLVYAARGLVFGIIAVFLGFFAAIISIIMVTRGSQAALTTRWITTNPSTSVISQLEQS